jgi:hypothetical protein
MFFEHSILPLIEIAASDAGLIGNYYQKEALRLCRTKEFQNARYKFKFLGTANIAVIDVDDAVPVEEHSGAQNYRAIERIRSTREVVE